MSDEFRDMMTIREVAAELGISASKASQIEMVALRKLRCGLGLDPKWNKCACGEWAQAATGAHCHRCYHREWQKGKSRNRGNAK